METLTIQIPEEELKLFKELIKKFNAKLVPTQIIAEAKPNRDTIAAMNEIKWERQKV